LSAARGEIVEKSATQTTQRAALPVESAGGRPIVISADLDSVTAQIWTQVQLALSELMIQRSFSGAHREVWQLQQGYDLLVIGPEVRVVLATLSQ
jgi:hypothetical protein